MGDGRPVSERARRTRRYNERRKNGYRVRQAGLWIDDYKLEKGCVDCGFNLWPEALHFDHVDPATKHAAPGWYDDRSKLRSRAKLAAFQAHVKRYCEVRCANCHAHRTHTEQHWRTRTPNQPTATDDQPTLF